jgi:hypothetical protein
VKRWRVMANDLKLGTGVYADNLSEQQAENVLGIKQKKYKNGRDKFDRAYFIQEYEESRYNK